MEKIWYKHYEPGVTHAINPNQYSSLVELLEQSCQSAGDRSAFYNLGTYLSYAELEHKTRAFAAYLQKELGLKPGDRVALMMPNLLQYPVALFGILRAGLTAVNVNPLYTVPELLHLLKDSDARVLVILANFAHVLEQALKEHALGHIIVTEIGDLFPGLKQPIVNFVVKYIKRMVPKYQIDRVIRFNDVLQRGAQLSFDRPVITRESVAFLQYTGGTTGVSKGAVLSHGNMLANVSQLLEWSKNTVEHCNEIVITALPLYHIFSLTVNCMVFLALESLNVLITNPRDLKSFIQEMKKFKFTAISGVNTLFNALVNHPKIREVDFSKTRFAMAGGMAVQKAVAEKWESITGCRIVEGYGLTEASPVLCVNPCNISGYNGSIGVPLPSTDISIRDEENNELPVGHPGELCAKGPQVMRGYWNSPEQSQKAFTADGWLKTGDIATMDKEGFLYIVDRKKDMIIVSGFNVFPNEVEAVIAQHPQVLEAAVVGVAHEQSGEMVKAFVVKKDPALSEQEIIEHCRKYLTRYKVPKLVEFRDELPKTNIGKILRRELR